MKSIQRLIILAAALFVAACGQSSTPQSAETEDGLSIPSGVYAVDKTHTFVAFSYFHQGLSYPLIRAIGVDGELDLDAQNIENSTVSVAVDIESIRTNLDFFDRELASRKFFHADKYPYATLTTNRYISLDKSIGKLEGQLTIRDVTRPVELDVTLNGAMEHPMLEKPVVGFSATGSFLRSEFGLDRFVPAVGDEITIEVEAEFLLGSNEGSASAARIAIANGREGDVAQIDADHQSGVER